MEKEELTYILGAGASYQAVPIVKTFPSRFMKFLNFIIGLQSEMPGRPEYTSEIGNNLKKLKEWGLALHDVFKSHQSFDTYFKKLFHTKNQIKIIRAKKLLNLYFIWEHLTKEEKQPNTLVDGVFWKQAKVDKRYDALIAGLLKPYNSASELYSKTNFITWNYDMNLITSIKNYFYPDDLMSDFLEKIQTEKSNHWNINNQIDVFNMNGYFYSSLFNDATNIYNTGAGWAIVNKMAGQYFDDTFIDKDADLVQFAWEAENEINNSESEISEIVKEKIESSSNIIVIGYTFPLYNRIADLNYFNKQTLHNKKLYVQDPNAIEIEKSIQENFNIETDYRKANHFITEIKSISNCDSFFVPSNIF